MTKTYDELQNELIIDIMASIIEVDRKTRDNHTEDEETIVDDHMKDLTSSIMTKCAEESHIMRQINP